MMKKPDVSCASGAWLQADGGKLVLSSNIQLRQMMKMVGVEQSVDVIIL